MVQFAEAPIHTVAVDYLTGLAEVIQRVRADALSRAIDCILEARAAHRRIFVMGNGGSAATASHLVCDLVKTASVPGRVPVRAFALTDNVPLMTAWANDSAYDRIFSEQIVAQAEVDDVVIGISASGNSANIVAGFVAATRVGARTIGLVGFDGGIVLNLAEIVIHVPQHDYGLVEDTHSAVGHAITAAMRAALLRTGQ
jgi:D-sedoheptulose 7-phosphate isomerase